MVMAATSLLAANPHPTETEVREGLEGNFCRCTGYHNITGFFETSLEPGELLSAVRVPRRPGARWGYQKFVRRANDWAIVGVAAIAGRVALASMGPVPVRARAVEQALAGGASPAEAASLAAEGTEPGEDIHANRPYRQHLARVLTRRALEDATP
jgi:aerobic carbon-monoxide dehydrogenase medium subunit